MLIAAHEKTAFEVVAPKLIENGYLPVPVVGADKRPALADWLPYRFKKADLAKYAGYSCGVLTGQAPPTGHAVAGVDIDSTAPGVVKEVVDYCLKTYGEGLIRVGNPPKTMLVYRVDRAKIPKKTGRWFVDRTGKDHRCEILGHGQQFVAHGIHPQTRGPYQWPGVGSLIETPVLQVPMIDEAAMTDILATFERVALRYGLTAKTDILTQQSGPAPDVAGMQPALGWEREDAERYLEPLDAGDRDTWIKIGMALHHEFNSGEVGAEIWDQWSATAPDKYVPGECLRKWRGFGGRQRNEITAAYIKKLYNAVVAKRKEKEEVKAIQDARRAIAETVNPTELLHVVVPNIAHVAEYSVQAGVALKNTVRARYKTLTGDLLDKSAINRIFSEPIITHTEYELTEIGNGQRLRDKYGDKLLFCPELDRWYRWDGRRYCPCVVEYVLRLAHATVEGIDHEAEQCTTADARQEVFKWARQSANSKMLDNMVKLIRKEPKIMVSPEALDSDPRYLGVSNGAVDLFTGGLIADTKRLKITLNTGIRYNVDAAAPVFEETLQDTFYCDQETIDFLQRVIGYTILGTPEKEEILVIPEGRGANGKSTIFNAVYHALGDYARFASADTFVTAKGSGGGAAREDVLRLMGARFVYITEFEENGVLREAFIKGLTGGEAVPARGVYSRHTVEVKPTWVSYMPTNHLPIIKGEDEGIWRRILVIPFRRDFSKDPLIKKDVHRKDKLKAEAEGILKWCIDGAAAYLRDGLNPPRQVQDVTRNYRRHMDLLSDWLEECCEVGPGLAARSRDLWQSFAQYGEQEGSARYINSSNALGRRLRDRGFTPIKSSNGIRGCGYLGLTLKRPEAGGEESLF